MGWLAALAALATGPAGALVPQPEAYCFAVADSGDNLVFINKDGDGFVNLGATGTGAMEAIAFNPDVSSCGTVGSPRNIPGCLYATNNDDFGFLDYDDSFDGDGNDSEFIQVSADVGTCTLPGGGTVTIDDVDGLQFDITRTDASTGTFVLWATERDGDGSAPNDILFQIDPNTGLVDTTPTPGFTGGATCVRIAGPGVNVDVDDVSVRPSDGIIYVVNNIGGGTDQLVEVDPVTGVGVIVGFFDNTNPPPAQISDMEGLSFGADAVLRGTTGGSGTSPNDFWSINTPDADTTLIAPFPSLGDYEAVACLTDNLITGTVFFDVEENGTYEPANGDEGFTGARIVVYIDNNNDGQIDGGDTQLCENPPNFTLTCPVTDPNGDWLFPVGQGNFVSEVDVTTLPAGATLTTDNLEEADFGVTDFGVEDPDNDYGYTLPPGSGDLDITKTSNAGGPVVQGQTFEYEIVVTNNTGITHSGIELHDILPPGVSYVAQSTEVTGPAEFYARDEFSAVSYGNNDGSIDWSGDWVEADDGNAGGVPTDPASGRVQITSDALRLNDQTGSAIAGGPSARRSVDLTGAANALLSFGFEIPFDDVDVSDSAVVEIASSSGGPFTVLETFTGIDFATVGQRVYDVTAFISADTTVRFRVNANYGGANEFFFADDVELRAAEWVFDTFEAPYTDPGSYQRQDGTFNWATDWLEIGESDGPTNGDILVDDDPDVGGGVLRVRDNDSGGEGVQREVDLSAYTTATLSFGYRRTDLDNVDDFVTVEASNNGGATWIELDRFVWEPGFVDDPAFIPTSYDISAFIASNTRVRFLSSPNLGGGDEVYFDNVRIDVRAASTVTKDNVPGGANPDLVDGTPPILIEPADGFSLTPGQSITATFEVTVDNPLDPYRASLLNTAVVTSDQSANPEIARHLDPVISGAIGDRVWLDMDGDGVQDTFEEGIANVEVSLRVDDDGTPGPSAGDSVYATRITDSNGEYLFDHLPPGDYWVDVTDATVPSGLVQSPGNLDQPTDPFGSLPLYTVIADEIDLTADFGYTAPAGSAIIGDYVWNDIDRDGIQDLNEVGIGGVTLDLISAGPDGVFGTGDDVVEDTVTTAADGGYLFTGVAPGEYIVEVTDTGGVLAGSSATSGPQSQGNDTSSPVTVIAGDLIDSVDFGYAPDACLPRIDFKTDALGSPLVSGQVIDTEYSAWGVAVSFTANAPSTGPAMIFDSANPTGGDVDLGSPNQTCAPPGPGVGTEGEQGQPGENCFPQGNLLIISEDGDSSDPDDGADGGTLTFSFSRDTRIDAVEFLDAENNLDSVELFDSTPSSIFFANLTAPGDNAFELLSVNTAGARSMVVTFPASGSISAIDFCLGSIRDKVWLDADGDGLFDVTEMGIAGVTVSLLSDPDGIPNNGDEVVIATTTTDADGNFGFDGLPDGAFVIEITDTNGELGDLGGTTAPAQAGTLAVSIVDSDDVVGINFGYNAPGTIGDRIWNDADGDGVDDPGELGIGGVTVDLIGPGPDGILGNGDDVVLATTTTAADGSYLFTGIAPGDYTVEVTDTGAVLSGFTQTGDPDATLDGEGTASIALGGSDLSMDFGYQNAALPDVSGNVFEDLDIDGLDDGAGEPGFQGVTLELRDATGNVVAVTTTDANGDYSFFDVPAGDYTVAVTDEAGILLGYQLTSGLDEIAITVVAADITDIDFGYVRLPAYASIGDQIWLDSDGDGIPGPNEAGLANVAVELYDAGPDGLRGTADDVLLATTVTDADGRYLFEDLPAGVFYVDVLESTLPETTPGDLTETTYPAGFDPSAVIALSEGEAFRDADFGYLPSAGTAALGDRVWYDADGDGLQDDGEIGIAGIDVTYVGAGPDGMYGTGDDTTATATTEAGGFYYFTGLPAGEYFVTFDAADVTALGYDPTPTNNGGDNVYNATLAAGDAFTHLDFGFDGGAVGSIGDFVWFDVNGDGDFDGGEDGIEGVTISLIQDTNGDGVWDPDGPDDMFGTADDEPIIDTTTTDLNGAYLFNGLPDGDYLIDVTDIDGSLVGLQKTSGAADANDNSQDDPYDVTITGAGNVLTADFGYTAVGEYGSISNFIWRDLDGDGVVDPLEPGIEGVSVELWLDVDMDGVITPGIDNLIRRSLTDANGEYEFKALPFADYLVDVTDDFGILAGLTKTTGPVPGADDNSQADPYAVTLTNSGPDNVTADFGYQDVSGAMSISGTVFVDGNTDGSLDFVDLDGDGIYDPAVSPDGADTSSESLVANATLSLYRVIGGDLFLIGTTTTDASGFYSFENLPAGDYEVHIDTTATTVDGYPQTTQTGSGGVQPVTLADTSDADWTQPNTNDSRNNNFGFWQGPITPTPVTLAYFEARAGGSFRWMTSTEVGNLGFNLYAVTDAGLEKLNDELIASPVVDSLEPQTYEFEARGGTGETFILEDIDIHGTLRHHGPFYLGQPEGADATQVRAVAWEAIRDQAGRKLVEKRGSTPYAQRVRQPLAPGTLGALGKSSAPIRQGDDPRCLGCDRGRRSKYGSADLGVDRMGIYRVSYEDLLAHGIDLTGAPSSALALTNRGVPVPIFVSSPAAFGPGSYVEFVGEPVDTLYTKTNVYRLAVDRWRAQRVDEAPFTGEAPEAFYLERQTFENQSQYNFASQSDDPWYDLRILAYSGPAAADVTFELDAWMPGFAPVEIDLDLAGGTDFPIAPDHHLVIDVNGSQIAESYFDGAERPELQLPVSDGLLAAGSNTVTLALPHDTGAEFDLVNYDSMTVTYPRAFVARNESLAFASAGSGFAVSGFGDSGVIAYGRRDGRSARLAAQVQGAPGAYEARFSGVSGADDGQYWVASSSGLLAPIISATRRPDGLTRHEADVVVISHESFLSGLDPWVERRESEGLRVQVVDVADLYAEYGYGLVDPAAIRKFIGIAEASMKTRYVLLVGGDTYDYFDYLGFGSISFVPSLYAQTDAIVRYAPVDPLYGDVDGDLIPDLAVGRWPVRTLAELEVVIAKTLEYDNTGRALRAVMASDGRDVPTGYSFTADSTDMAELLGTGWDVEHVSLDELAIPDAREALISGINAGPSLTSYFGHSSLSVWSFDGLFESADVDLLTNSSAPTIVTQWGCWNTYHVLPSFETLGNRLLLEPDAGAAAVLGASTLTEALSERRLGMRLFDRLSTPGLKLGDAVTAAKRELAETEPDRLDVILGWTLLGDPTLTVVSDE